MTKQVNKGASVTEVNIVYLRSNSWVLKVLWTSSAGCCKSGIQVKILLWVMSPCEMSRSTQELICILDDVLSQENYLHTFMSEVLRIATKKTDLASENALETRPAVPGQVAIRPVQAGYYFSHSWSSCQG